MNILVLGGGGAMARAVMAAMPADDAIARIVIADRNRVGAQLAGQELPDPLCNRVASLELDVGDGEKLAYAVTGADLVINCVGPYFRFGVPVLQAAIEAGADYLDLCDDWEPTLEMLALDEQAKSRGVRAVIGIGASPGVSNLMARMAVEQLDQPERLVTAWSTSIAGEAHHEDELHDEDGRPSAAIVHWMAQISGQIQVQKDGTLQNVTPLQPLELELPGRGKRTLYSVGHPEPVSLVRRYPGLDFCINAMAGEHALFTGLQELQVAIDGGLISLDDAAATLVSKLGEFPQASESGDNADTPRLFAVCEGNRDGRRQRVLVSEPYLGDGSMAQATGVPLATAVLLRTRGIMPPLGVCAAEDAFDPETFFTALNEAYGGYTPHRPFVLSEEVH